MADSRTTHLNLVKQDLNAAPDYEKENTNLDTIDNEIFARAKFFNGSPVGEDGGFHVTTMPYANNLMSTANQEVTEAFSFRTTGGNASVQSGAAQIVSIKGNRVHNNYVSPESRGTIVVSTPTSFKSTGWNLYQAGSPDPNYTGFARVVKYSNTYGYRIDGDYTTLTFEAPDGQKSYIEVTNHLFSIPSDGVVWVTGGVFGSTSICATWSDWTLEANGGVWETYRSYEIDALPTIMSTLFPNGMCRVGDVRDEINFSQQKAISYIERLDYSAQNLAIAQASELPYECDTNYIYLVRSDPVVMALEPEAGKFTANDHGTEILNGTVDRNAYPEVTILYGNDLRNKLERDVLTVSQQSLTNEQKAQVRENIGVESPDGLIIKSLGTFAADSALANALDGLLATMEPYSIVGVRFNFSTATSTFRANHYYGLLSKAGSNDNGTITLVNVSTVVDPINGAKAGGGWNFRPNEYEFLVNANSSKQITMPNNSRGAVYTLGGATNLCGRFEVFVSSTGTILNSAPTASDISVTKTTNKITIANGNTSANAIVKIVMFDGSAS